MLKISVTEEQVFQFFSGGNINDKFSVKYDQCSVSKFIWFQFSAFDSPKLAISMH